MDERPSSRLDVFEVRRGEHSLDQLQMIAGAVGYRFFSHRGVAYRITGEEHGQWEAIGLISDLFPEPAEEGVARAAAVLSPTSTEGQPSVADRVKPAIVVADGFYALPHMVREAALRSSLEEHPERHKGLRSPDQPIPDGIGEFLATVTGPIGHGYCCYQLNVAGEQLVHHSDHQRWAAAVYLTPQAPPSGGTSFYRSRTTRVRSSEDLALLAGRDGWPSAGELEQITYGGKLLDRTAWEEVDRVGNVYNRIAIWDARMVHAVSENFGHDRETGRLCQLFFWDQA